NRDIAAQLDRLADLLEVEGANAFRVRAYRNAARTVSDLSPRVTDLVAQGADLTTYPGIGKDLAGQIATLIETGRLPPLDEIAQRVPPELSDLMQIQGLGPKGVKKLYEQFQIRTLSDLEQVARAGEVRGLPGFGTKKEQALLEGIERLQNAGAQRTRIDVAHGFAEPLREWLAATPGISMIEVAGSYRRRRETVGDLDIVVACSDGDALMDRLLDYRDLDQILSRGRTRSSVRLGSNLQVDVRAVAPESYGAALLYFTGSREHNIALRQRAIDRGLKLNEYGLFDGHTPVAGADEWGIYAQLDLAWIPPELRESTGEIEDAERNALPQLVTVAEIRGNLHGHTTWSDGRDSLEDMAAAAQARGYEYLAITDHGPRVQVANGLDARRLAAQAEAIDTLNARLDGLTLLKGCEVDILEDGQLDLPDEVLAHLDIVVCSTHYNLRLSREQQTERVLRAMDNPHFMIWGHPTARNIPKRDPIDIDLERCIGAAAE
ncbi:MAG: helix-hairpin-helix domain-containing protein, partial [Halofilum sp. (in: g-proteobacteria)]